MRRVLHVVGRFLPRTETFIYTVVTHHIDYDASVLCHSRLHESEFPFARVHVFATRYQPAYSSGRARIPASHFGPFMP